jgi:hypothetical protein
LCTAVKDLSFLLIVDEFPKAHEAELMQLTISQEAMLPLVGFRAARLDATSNFRQLYSLTACRGGYCTNSFAKHFELKALTHQRGEVTCEACASMRSAWQSAV